MAWDRVRSGGLLATEASTAETKKLANSSSQGNLPGKRWHLKHEGHIQQRV